ncbi:hypothetical protein KGQ34_03105 [Patescibacteria group bacterium]|nr:hypothetical protein [Patescibacteria group bacterium]
MVTEAAELIKKAKRIGIVLPDVIDADSLGSAYGLLNILRESGRETTLFFSKPIPPTYQFLAPATEKKPAIEPARKTESPQDLIISINTSEHPIQEVRYEKEDGIFSVIVSPKKGDIKKEDVEFYSGNLPIDLFVAIDIASPDELPESFNEHLENFSKKPVVAVTQKTTDEFFSDATVCDEKSSLAESVYLLVEKLGYAVSPEAAAWLLCGIIEKTKNFSLGAPREQTLSIASSLIALGADKERIVRNLFSQKNEEHKTKEPSAQKNSPHNLLQLWGRALVRSRYDEAKQIVWSFIPQNDFAQTKTASRDIAFVIKKMAEHVPDSRLGIFLLENPHKNHVRAVIDPRDAALEEKFMSALGDSIEKKQGLLIFKNAFPNFIEAENRLLEFLSAVQ